MRSSHTVRRFERRIPARRRGGVLAAAIAALALGSVCTLAAISANSGSSTTTKESSKAERKLQPGEVAVVLHLLGIHPDSFAAAGGTGLACDALFDTGSVYCLQAERLTQLQLAHRDVNLASEKAVRPEAPGAVNGQGQQISLEQAKTALTNLESAGYTFMTTGMDGGIASRLSVIKANQHWGLPPAYLVVNRSDEDWLRLRGALCARRVAQDNNQQLSSTIAQFLATVEGDSNVAAALSSFAAGINGVKTSWRAHEGPNP